MTLQRQYSSTIRVLWYLKVPEVLATITAIVTFVLFLVGICPFYIPEYAFVIRLILIPVRLMFVSRKRSMEKLNPSLKSTKRPNADKEIKRIVSELEMIQMRNTDRIMRFVNYVFKK